MIIIIIIYNYNKLHIPGWKKVLPIAASVLNVSVQRLDELCKYNYVYDITW